MDAEIARVKRLKHGGQWLKAPGGTKAFIYQNDSITKLKGCGKKTAENSMRWE